MLRAILDRPGIHKSALARRTGLSWGTVGHHLRVLEREGRIGLLRVGRTVHAAPASFVEGLRSTPALADPEARRVLGLLVTQRFARGATDLGRTMGLSRKQTRRHLRELEVEGLVESDDAYHPRYRSTPEGDAAAASLAVEDFGKREPVRTAVRVV